MQYCSRLTASLFDEFTNYAEVKVEQSVNLLLLLMTQGVDLDSHEVAVLERP